MAEASPEYKVDWLSMTDMPKYTTEILRRLPVIMLKMDRLHSMHSILLVKRAQ